MNLEHKWLLDFVHHFIVLICRLDFFQTIPVP